MKNLHFGELNTFNKGRWEGFASKFSSANGYTDNCEKFYKYCKNTPLCLCDMKHIKEWLVDNDFFVFVDNKNTLQIVGNCNAYGELDCFRGIVDGQEQNVDLKFLDVANEFFDKNIDIRFCEGWKKQINWIARLHQYTALFNSKRYNEINIENLIDDLGYNGFNLHYKDCTKENKKRIYYPIIKRELISQPMLKPMLASHFGCKTNEIFVGKYGGNDKNIKYIIGDCISQYLSEDCRLEKVFGAIEIKNYFGKIDLLNIPTTRRFLVTSAEHLPFDIEKYLGDVTIITRDSELEK